MCVHLEIEVAKAFKNQQSREKGTQRAVTVPMRVLPLRLLLNDAIAVIPCDASSAVKIASDWRRAILVNSIEVSAILHHL